MVDGSAARRAGQPEGAAGLRDYGIPYEASHALGKDISIPRLTLRGRAGVYAKGQARILQILNTAYDIVMSSGYAALTLREIARRCDIRNGAVSYYYKTKDDLVQDLLEAALAPYKDFAGAVESDETTAPHEKLRLIIKMILSDLRTEKTTKFYPEFWAISNHDDGVAVLVDQIYAAMWDVTQRLIRTMNPVLNDDSARNLSIYISGTLVGLLPFIGFGKCQSNRFDAISAFTANNLLSTVTSATNELFE